MGVPFEKLNSDQKNAVKATGKRILVLAGPGTGKTEVLAHRIRHLIKERNVNPSEILAITFTMKAAREMQNRLKEFSDINSSKVRILTIHGECWRILCKNSTEKKIIADTDEEMMILQDTIEDLKLNKKYKELNEIQKKIGLCKANNKLPEDFGDLNSEFVRIFKKYEELMQFNKAIDFSGILTTVIRLFNDTEILKKLHKTIRYILVDEYQDINKAQFEFIKSLCSDETELFCVGDDDQSIYSWRGATPDFILNFERDFSGSRLLELKETRRCSENILKAALNLISKLKDGKRKVKNMYAYNKDGDPIYILKSSSEIQEALWTSKWIKSQLTKKNLEPQDIAILCKDLELAQYVVSELKKEKVPVEYWKEGALFKDKEVKIIISHLKVIVNPNNNLALRRCLSKIPLIGQKRISEIRKEAQNTGKSLWNILPKKCNTQKLHKWQLNLKQFIEWVKELRKKMNNEPVGFFIREITDRISLSKDNKYIEKLKNMPPDLSKMSVRKFIDEIVIKRNLDITGGGAEPEEERNAVAVMSMHSSKGLTFKVVFILGMEEGIFPKNNSNVDDEERRLFYVAMTRAKQKLFLCTAIRRKGRPAQGISFYDKPSVFFDDILPCKIQKIHNYKTAR